MNKYEVTKALWIAVLPEYTEDLRLTEMTCAVKPNRDPISIYERDALNYDVESGFRLIMDIK